MSLRDRLLGSGALTGAPISPLPTGYVQRVRAEQLRQAAPKAEAEGVVESRKPGE